MGGNIYRKVLETMESSNSIAIETVFRGTAGSLKEDMQRTLKEAEPAADSDGHMRAGVLCREENGSTVLCEPVFPPERLVILGGGHVALQLCEMASKCEFRTTVCDDRPEFADRRRFAAAEDVMCGPFEDCLRSLRITPFDYVVILTRGHAHDGDCLRAILSGTEPAYTGMIGSRRKVSGLLDELRKEGFRKEKLDRICAPIGLRIGAVTPQEIAVSIMAQLIAYRRMPEHANGRVCRDTDLTPEIIRYLAEETGPKAVATVIETRGSTPRRAGAKMAVTAEGKIIGTIGGGGGEAAVIREAGKMIGTGMYRVCFVDMTGQVAEREGMVCGGSMKVLIEDGCAL